MKKALLILIPSFIFASVAFLIVQSIILRGNEKGALQVTSSPQSEVFINGKSIGKTPLCKCDPKDMLRTGEYTIRIVPLSGGFSEFQEKITISKSVLTVVDRKFGKGATSEGSIITLEPLKEGNKRELLVISKPDKSEVLLDNTPSGFSPILLKDVTESDHEIILKKTGYTEKRVRIRTPNGYKLVASVYLGVDEDGVIATPTPTVSPTASPSATITPVSLPTKITILQTPNGFLRVRQTASTSSDEIGRVNPGDTFDILDEAPGWYKIKLTTGDEGWISSQYARKEE